MIVLVRAALITCQPLAPSAALLAGAPRPAFVGALLAGGSLAPPAGRLPRYSLDVRRRYCRGPRRRTADDGPHEWSTWSRTARPSAAGTASEGPTGVVPQAPRPPPRRPELSNADGYRHYVLVVSRCAQPHTPTPRVLGRCVSNLCPTKRRQVALLAHCLSTRALHLRLLVGARGFEPLTSSVSRKARGNPLTSAFALSGHPTKCHRGTVEYRLLRSAL